MASIKLKGDTSGEVTIQAPAVAGTTTLNLPATSSTLATQNALGVRNLIINGDMRIDQRNAGASVSSNNSYAVDRLRNVFTSSGSFTAQQSTTAPDNFTNSVVWTVGSAASATSSQVANMQYRLEGNTLYQLGLGTSAAKTMTLSFWVRSSVTGTYCAAFINSAADRAYVAEYTISSANTWEQKSITLTGDTSGTWLTTNGIGLRIQFDLGSGSDYNATANTWVGANDFRTTNQTDFINNAGATFYITGIQLEVGDTATPFEHRPFDQELLRCQRYFCKSFRYSDAVAEDATSPAGGGLIAFTTTDARTVPLFFPTTMRTNATITIWKGGLASTSGRIAYYTSSWQTSSSAGVVDGIVMTNWWQAYATGSFTVGRAYIMQFTWTADAEL